MKIYSLFILAIVLISCEINKRPSENNIDILQGMKNCQDILLSEICDNIQYIKLETCDSSLFNGNNCKIYFISNFIFILSDNQLLKFEKNGSFVNKINRIGRGPQEFLQIRCLGVDTYKQEIYLYDNLLRKIEVLDLNLNTKKVFSNIRSDIINLKVKDNTIICGLERNDYLKDPVKKSICVLSAETGKELYFKVSHIPPIQVQQNPIFTLGTILTGYEDRIYYQESHSNNIYWLKPQNISDSLLYRINCGKPYPMKIDYIPEKQDLAFDYYRFEHFAESQRYLFLGFYPPKENLRIAMYDKVQKELRVAKSNTYFQNDIDNWMSPDYFYLVDNTLVYTILPSKVLDNSLRSDKLISKYNTTVIEKLISQTKIDDNPIIMLCNLK